MKKTFKVVVDCDDVLFDCNGYAVTKLNREKEYAYKKEDITAWGELGCGLDERLIYFRDPVFVRDMPVLPKAREFIQALSRRAEIFIATSVAAECAGERVSSIIRNFPEINPENILIGTRKDMLKADMLLDDCPDHIRSAEVTYPVPPAMEPQCVGRDLHDHIPGISYFGGYGPKTGAGDGSHVSGCPCRAIWGWEKPCCDGAGRDRTLQARDGVHHECWLPCILPLRKLGAVPL